GNVLTPVPVQNNSTPAPKKTSNTPSNQTSTVAKSSPAPTAVKKAPVTKPATPVAAKAPVVTKTPQTKPAPVVQPRTKAAPVVAKAPVVKTKKGPVPVQVDYIKRVQFVHNLVVKRIPQSVLDSIADVNHYMLDSIRSELGKHRDKDSISFLKTALSNGLNDSLTLIGINGLVNSAKGTEPTQSTGAVNAYCIDLASQAPMDSVKVSIFSHDSLIANAFSANDGFCKISELKPGEYSLAFSKNNYTPFSDRWVKVTAGNVTYLEMPLTETPRFYLPKFSPQIWAMIIVGVISVFVLIYSIIRRLGRVA
ncbi:MAG TPA: carboxypeptidase regulatory-like domain-containing protein, partial [Bacteroidia bacterium]|nr:carboxypeptidase regulatory-like domain-containing protein [Bacteroidia bacterium]